MPTVYKDEIKHISERGQESRPAVKRQRLMFTAYLDERAGKVIDTVARPEHFHYVWQVNDNIFAAADQPKEKDPALFFGRWVDE